MGAGCQNIILQLKNFICYDYRMEKYKPLFLALAVSILFFPLAFYVRKFTQIDTPAHLKVGFNPLACYQCRECSCEFTLNDGDTYKLSQYDKTICKVGQDAINEGLNNKLSYMTVEMKVPEYRKFMDCLKWYSNHPSSFSGR
jgi:hypothetical protein